MPGEGGVRFLSVEDVKRLHDLSIARYGGGATKGCWSAVQMAAQTFTGAALHPTLGAQAGAYPFHLTQNHAFLDGNKRTGLLACVTFRLLNGHGLMLTSEEAEETTLAVAAGQLSKEDLVRLLDSRLIPLQPLG